MMCLIALIIIYIIVITYLLYLIDNKFKKFYHDLLHIHVIDNTVPPVWIDDRLYGVCKHCGCLVEIRITP